MPGPFSCLCTVLHSFPAHLYPVIIWRISASATGPACRLAGSGSIKVPAPVARRVSCLPPTLLVEAYDCSAAQYRFFAVQPCCSYLGCVTPSESPHLDAPGTQQRPLTLESRLRALKGASLWPAPDTLPLTELLSAACSVTVPADFDYRALQLSQFCSTSKFKTIQMNVLS